MSFPHFDLVQRAYNELIAEGKIKQRSTQEEAEADKGLLTQRSGWYVHTERSPAIGVLEKLEGNNYLGFSVDLLIQTDGTFWDVATDSGGMAQPVNGGPSSDPALIPRWRMPSAALAQISETTPPPEPPPVDTVTNEELLDELQAMESRLATQADANMQKILDTIDSIKTQVEESLQKALALLVIHRRRGEDDADETGGVV
jgi:hypothetical protein